MKFRMRYIAGGALALGLAAGVWMADWFKGFGPGGGEGDGLGGSGWQNVQTNADADAPELGVAAIRPATDTAPAPLKVVIKDRSYFLRDGDADTPIELEALVAAVKQQPADADGIRLRLYKTNSARVTAELQLFDALRAAGLTPEAAVYVGKEAVE